MLLIFSCAAFCGRDDATSVQRGCLRMPSVPRTRRYDSSSTSFAKQCSPGVARRPAGIVTLAPTTTNGLGWKKGATLTFRLVQRIGQVNRNQEVSTQNENPKTHMKQISSVFFIAVLLSAVLVFGKATPPNPAPPPELKKLDFLVGTWKVQGELISDSPSPGGKFSFLNRYAWKSGRYFLVLHSTTTGALGNATGTSYYGYSPEDKSYTYDAFNSLGQAEHAKGTLEGNTWVWIDTEDFLGQVVKGRYIVTVTSPTSYHSEISCCVAPVSPSRAACGDRQHLLSASCQGGATPGDYFDWRQQNASFSKLGAFIEELFKGFDLLGDGASRRTQ